MEDDNECEEEGDASAAIDVGVFVRLGEAFELATNANAAGDDGYDDVRRRQRRQKRTAMATGERCRIILWIDRHPTAAMVMTTMLDD